jgi:hypothetical protein
MPDFQVTGTVRTKYHKCAARRLLNFISPETVHNAMPANQKNTQPCGETGKGNGANAGHQDAWHVHEMQPFNSPALGVRDRIELFFVK